MNTGTANGSFRAALRLPSDRAFAPPASPSQPGESVASRLDGREYRLFRALDVHREGAIAVGDFLEVLARAGVRADDARLRETIDGLESYSLRDRLGAEDFCGVIRPNILLVEQALQGNLAIPDFPWFSEEIETMYQLVRRNRQGDVAAYIPQLARVDPELFGVAFCTIDGQRASFGDATADFCVQSCCKPVNYCLALEEHGEDEVHRFVGREPSGRIFNELTLSAEGKPHNPMINAGAIMCASLIRGDLDSADRFDHVRGRWRALCGEQKVGFNNSVYQSERNTADRNFALGYYMREHGAFPDGTDLLQTLEFYFQCCSIEVNAEAMAVLAATLANGGVCPASGERVLKTANVQHCLSLMCSCGMYDFSGEFAFSVGLPAKSGVGGALLVVIPNVMGLCIFSPRLDGHGNPVRGIEFCKRLVSLFNFHNYDALTGESQKKDPRVSRVESQARTVQELIWAASKGDQGAVHRLIVRGFDQDASDYDRRTALHLAAAEGRETVVHYLLQNGAQVNPRDRWGGTPLDDARRHAHTAVVELLERHGGRPGSESVPDSDSVGFTRTGGESEPHGVIELIYAASFGDLSSVQRMVARGADLGGADYDLRTPLHLAAAEGHEPLVQYLLEQGVPADPRDRWGGTPLDDARRHGNTRVAQLLAARTSWLADGREVTPRGCKPGDASARPES